MMNISVKSWPNRAYGLRGGNYLIIVSILVSKETNNNSTISGAIYARSPFCHMEKMFNRNP